MIVQETYSFSISENSSMQHFLSKMTLMRIFLLIGVLVFGAPSAIAQVTISGRLLGVHGKPMELAHILMSRPPDYLPQKIIATDNNGSYSFTVDSQGIWIFKFIGVHHREKNVAVFLNDQANIGLDVQLGSFTYVKDFDNVKVNSSLNYWNILSPFSMQKDSSGMYSAVIHTTFDTIEYQLMNVRYGGLYEGTQADRYAYRNTRGYVSISAAHENKVTIVFDPAKLPEGDIPAQVQLSSKDSRIVEFSRLYEKFERAKELFRSYMADHIRGHRRPDEFSFNWEPIISPIDKQLEKETDPLLREMLYFSRLSIASMKKDSDQLIYKIAIDSIPPSSCIWLLDPSLMYYALTHAGYTNEQQHEYIYNILRCSHERRVKSILLFNMFHAAKYSDQTDYAAEYYEVLTNQFGETQEAQFVKEKFQRDYAFKKGNPIPEFSLHSVDDPAMIINNLSLRGKYVLIDFWAQWGHQCIADMNALHHLYEKYKHQRFTIFSVSMDSTVQQFVAFKKIKWKMPWINAYIGSRIDTGVAAKFQVITIPKRYLIDPQGNLIALGEDLAAAKLEETLKKYINK